MIQFKLVDLIKIDKNLKPINLFLIASPLTATTLKSFNLNQFEGLLQKYDQTENKFVNASQNDCELAFFISSDYQKTFKQKKALEPCFNWLKQQKNAQIYICFPDLAEETIRQCIEVIVKNYIDVSYQFNHCKQRNEQNTNEQEIFLVVDKPELYAENLNEAIIISNHINLAKDLANLPSNICTPKYLANFAKTKAEELKVDCTIFDQDQIKELGMNSFLSVAKGSVEEPYFIQLEYHAGNEKDRPIVLVGKGITFDSGGISLKPAKSMDEMKYDMCGAANVLLTFFAAVELKLPVNLVTLVPTCENMPSGSANKPGDIVTSLKGLSIEILNTDAEGRLILCDALTYAEKFNPKVVIDVATLTGACLATFGGVASGILGSDQNLIDELLVASQNTDDKIWQLPLWEEYHDELKSNFADLPNIGSSGYAGTITAAAFLSHFIDKKYPWAHLDIAGTAWKKDNPKGATGKPIKLLIEFLRKKSR